MVKSGNPASRLVFNRKSIKKVRIVCSDPNATDSSDDEATNEIMPQRIKRYVHEIHLGIPICLNFVKSEKSIIGCSKRATQSKKISSRSALNLKERALQFISKAKNPRPRNNKTSYKGVRLRKSGKWSAEIRDPFEQRRLWLGTYDTPETASRVYEAKWQEFLSKAMELATDNIHKSNCSFSDDIATIRMLNNQPAISRRPMSFLPHDSPSSVLESESNVVVDDFNCTGILKDLDKNATDENGHTRDGCSAADTILTGDQLVDLMECIERTDNMSNDNASSQLQNNQPTIWEDFERQTTALSPSDLDLANTNTQDDHLNYFLKEFCDRVLDGNTDINNMWPTATESIPVEGQLTWPEDVNDARLDSEFDPYIYKKACDDFMDLVGIPIYGLENETDFELPDFNFDDNFDIQEDLYESGTDKSYSKRRSNKE